MIKRMLIAICLMASVACGSWVFDSTDKVEITDSATLDIPDGNCAFAMWYKVDPNMAGSSYRVLIEWGNWGVGNGNLGIWAYETSEATYGDDIRLLHRDDDGSEEYLQLNTINNNPLADPNWHHFVNMRTGTTHYIYIDGVQIDSYLWAAGNGFTPDANTFLGQSPDGGKDWLGKMAEAAFWTRTLTETEIDKLSGTNGETSTSPGDIADATGFTWHFDMYDALDTTSQVGSLSASHTGTTADSADHPVSYAAPSAANKAYYLRRMLGE